MKYLILLCGVLLVGSSCGDRSGSGEPLFVLLSSKKSGIDFENKLSPTEELNMYVFKNYYNGGGAAVGDLNNDGLDDIYFCGNQVPNKLFTNKGNLKFEDTTEKAGVACENVWSTGASLVDIDGDGWLDIYVCKSGPPESPNRRNELFINNQDGTFTEKAADFGLDNLGLSSHAAFFDYDKDGDLDCYLLNNSIRSVGGYDLIKDLRTIPDPEGGNALFRNDDGFFNDVSEEAGIYNSAIGFGLGVTVGDVNQDHWPDLFISNDFFERDYLYINNQDGTFSEDITNRMAELSLSSMGADMADLNNNGAPEIFVTDMLPESNQRIKTKTQFENWDKYQLNIEKGYHRQFTRNTLQLNNGDGTFNEVGRFANVYATDWSWGALLFDFQNDGLKDIFVANGIGKDLTDQDYINFYANPQLVAQKIRSGEKNVITKLMAQMPSVKLPNYAFVNQGNLNLENKSEQLGLAQPSFSNGSAYSDLDNDGDLDLVVNNVDMPAFIYENKTNAQTTNNYISVRLKGNTKNAKAIGTQVTAWKDGQQFYQELSPFRGFQSSTTYDMVIGLGEAQALDSLVVIWPELTKTILENVNANQTLLLNQKDALQWTISEKSTQEALLKEVNAIDFTHQENDYKDFDRERLIYQMISADGPKISIGDINGDLREDIFIGGPKGIAGTFLIQTQSGKFASKSSSVLDKDKGSEDTGSALFDVDNDGDLDIYICSGGNEFSASSTALTDRLYLNDGNGNFQRSQQILPGFELASSSTVQPHDFDLDGDIDLFVGTRLLPSLYGVPAPGYLLENDGNGKFKNVADTKAPAFKSLGLVKEATWADITGDGIKELIVVGEWMPVKVFKFLDDVLMDITEKSGLQLTNGFWNTIATADVDLDGDLDLIAGNLGLNSQLKASKSRPITMHTNDFDQNGTVEQIISTYNGDKAYPIVLRQDLIVQIPYLKRNYLKFENYKDATLSDMFTPEQLERAVELKVYETRSIIFFNDGTGQFSPSPMPLNAQFSSVNAVLVTDVNADNLPDILLGGNFFRAKPELGINAASKGLVLLGKGEGKFENLSADKSGFVIEGELKDLQPVLIKNKQFIIAARNDDKIKVFKYE